MTEFATKNNRKPSQGEKNFWNPSYKILAWCNALMCEENFMEIVYQDFPTPGKKQ